MTNLYLSLTDNSDMGDGDHSDRRGINEDRLTELLNARYMALDHVAASDTARSLCRLLAAEATAADPQRKRGRRGQKREQFERAVAAVTADLLLGHGRELSSLSYRPLGPSEFTGSEVSYRNFIAVLRGFEALGLIERVAQGFFDRSEISMGYTTRFQPSCLLLEVCLKASFLPSEAKDHFINEGSGRTTYDQINP